MTFQLMVIKLFCSKIKVQSEVFICQVYNFCPHKLSPYSLAFALYILRVIIKTLIIFKKLFTERFQTLPDAYKSYSL